MPARYDKCIEDKEKEHQEIKSRNIISMGLYFKEYSEHPNEEFNKKEYVRVKDGNYYNYRYYKCIPDELTDAQYERL